MGRFKERIARFIILMFLLVWSASMSDFPISAEEEFPSGIFTLDNDIGYCADPDPWNEGIYASYYGSVKGRKYFGCISNRLYPKDEYFVALPSREDCFECLDGRLQVKLDDESGLFRVIEIKPHGEEGPIFEATVEDVGPWFCGDDPYWETGARPASEDGWDDKGRDTNRAGIDLSYILALDMGIDGIGLVDWRFKKVDGEYVAITKQTDFR